MRLQGGPQFADAAWLKAPPPTAGVKPAEPEAEVGAGPARSAAEADPAPGAGALATGRGAALGAQAMALAGAGGPERADRERFGGLLNQVLSDLHGLGAVDWMQPVGDAFAGQAGRNVDVVV